MDGEVVCWPACPLAEGAPGGLWVIPGFLTPNQRFARALDTIQAGIRHPPPAPGQTFDHQGTRVYWPCGDDVERMSRLFPGCQPDAIPWDRVKAELVAAPPALVESRDWSLVPAAALLILVERLRGDLAADDAASRGIAEPTTPHEPAGKPTDPRIVSQGEKAKLVLLDLFKSGEGCPSLSDLEGKHGISRPTFSKAANALKDHHSEFKKWYQPRPRKARAVGNVTKALIEVEASRPNETATSITDWRELRRTLLAHPNTKHMRTRLEGWTDEDWREFAASGQETFDAFMDGLAEECKAETYTRRMPAEDGSGRVVERTFTRRSPRVRPG